MKTLSLEEEKRLQICLRLHRVEHLKANLLQNEANDNSNGPIRFI